MFQSSNSWQNKTFESPSKRTSKMIDSKSNPVNGLDETSLKQLEAATQVMDERLEREQGFGQRAQLDSLLQGHSSSEYSNCPNINWAPLVKRRTIHLPDVLFDQYDIQEHRCLMGVFPEIERAWFTVDNRLFLWDYAGGSDFASFEQLEEIISAISIARPRPGLFVSDIQHLLVIATPLAVTLVGLAFSNSNSRKSGAELSLYLTGLSVPTDGIVFTTIHCHNSTGRIFLIGSTDTSAGQLTGNELFEFEYRSEESWFKKRCALINHSRGGTGVGTLSSLLPSWLNPITEDSIVLMSIDQDRNLIYVLSKSGSIRMLSLGNLGKEAPSEISSVSNVVREALGMCPSAGPLLDPRTFEINDLHIISKQEGGKIGLVATTTLGVRMYFSHAKRGYGYGYTAISSSLISDQRSPPNSIWLCHVRLPPRNSTQGPQTTGPQSSLTLSAGFQANSLQNPSGNGESSGEDVEFTPIPSPLNIMCTHYTSPGGFWIAAHSVDPEHNVIVAAAPDVAQHLRAASLNVKTSTTPFSSQQQQQTPQVAILEVACPIPIEGHAWAITKVVSGNEHESTNTQLIGSQQEWLVLSNMGITILSSLRPVDTLAALLDSMPGRERDLAMFWERFGRDQTCAMSICIAVSQTTLAPLSDLKNPKNLSFSQAASPSWGADAAAQAKKLLHESSGRPEIFSTGTQPSLTIFKFWLPDGAITNTAGIPEGTKVLFSGKHEGLALYMAWLLRPIWKEKVITLSEMMLLTSVPDARSVGRIDPLVYNLEQSSILGLRVLLSQAVEALSFVIVLIDYKLSELLQECPSEVCQTLLGLHYRDFITGKLGRSCARELVKTLINRQIVAKPILQLSTVHALTIVTFQAIEALNRAKESKRITDKHNAAREALQLFQTGVKHMTIEVLQSSCNKLTEIASLDGVVELALNYARVWDSDGQALEYWRDGRPKSDSRAGIYELLDKCYTCIETSLIDTDISVLTANGLSVDEASMLREHAIKVALSCGDELFHYHYYECLLKRNNTTWLLEARTPYLETYLKSPPLTLVKADLLWQHYTRNSAFLEAARILANLASDDGLSLPLSRRIEYLSLAISNAKSSPHLTSGDGEAFTFLTDVEERLDVAQVQVEILQNVMDVGEEDFNPALGRKEDVVDVLQRRLLTISELYRNVVEPLGLLESTLLVFHVSDHQDTELTAKVWQAIIDQAHAGRPGGIQGPEAVASKVTELGRKFYPSDIAFNMSIIVPMLAKYAMDNPLSESRRWVAPVLREAGVPWQATWEALDEIFASKLPPWHTDASSAFLAFQLAGVIEEWLNEVLEAQDLSPTGTLDFPATRLDDMIDQYVDALACGPSRRVGQRNQSQMSDEADEYAKAAKSLKSAKIKVRETF
ncbi:Non-repetitive/WGA-negative nucleoporin C-terminal-domain-containing protein [Phakopsora pachyrhizi]|nr:Non-repetitive/WGA-negative nucleoporin C-terminal-domain-containing protein [Phakopsora pachyrhizi]